MVSDSFMNSEESRPPANLKTSTRSEYELLTSEKKTMMSKAELGWNTNQKIQCKMKIGAFVVVISYYGLPDLKA